MPRRIRQSNEIFVEACGCSNSKQAADLALVLRDELAKYGRVKTDDITSEKTFLESGIFHPSDSIDLLEYTLMLEHLTGVRFEPEEVVKHFAPEREEMTIGEWIRRVISLTSAKGGLIRACL